MDRCTLENALYMSFLFPAFEISYLKNDPVYRLCKLAPDGFLKFLSDALLHICLYIALCHLILFHGIRAHLPAIACKQRPSFLPPPCGGGRTFGISIPFGMLSPTGGQVAHALLTRSPLRTYRNKFSVRLACVKHAASVRPEPGSNSPK